MMEKQRRGPTLKVWYVLHFVRFVKSAQHPECCTRKVERPPSGRNKLGVIIRKFHVCSTRPLAANHYTASTNHHVEASTGGKGEALYLCIRIRIYPYMFDIYIHIYIYIHVLYIHITYYVYIIYYIVCIIYII